MYDSFKFYKDIHDCYIPFKGYEENSFPARIGVDYWDKNNLLVIRKKRSPYHIKYQRKPSTEISFKFLITDAGIEFAGTYPQRQYDEEDIRIACQAMRELTIEYERYHVVWFDEEGNTIEYPSRK